MGPVKTFCSSKAWLRLYAALNLEYLFHRGYVELTRSFIWPTLSRHRKVAECQAPRRRSQSIGTIMSGGRYPGKGPLVQRAAKFALTLLRQPLRNAMKSSFREANGWIDRYGSEAEVSISLSLFCLPLSSRIPALANRSGESIKSLR